jgi:hypothetical protein
MGHVSPMLILRSGCVLLDPAKGEVVMRDRRRAPIDVEARCAKTRAWRARMMEHIDLTGPHHRLNGAR